MTAAADGFPIKLFSKVPAWLWVVALWAALYVANAGVRELHWEEGSRALQAQSMLAGGHWLVPEVCGQRYLLKPPMLPWLIAASSCITGGVNEWAARLPSLLATLAAALAVCFWVQRLASPGAGLFAAACFLLSPLALQKGALAETDMLVTCCSFAAFFLWWRRFSFGAVGIRWWTACGLILAVGAMAKGPPALLYFVAAALVLVLWKRRFRELPGFLLCTALGIAAVTAWALVARTPGDEQIWRNELFQPRSFGLAGYLREHLKTFAGALAGTLPWLAAGMLAAVPRWRRRLEIDPSAAAALVVYAAAGSLLLLFSTRSSVRYALPMVPAVAVAAGLAFHRLYQARRRAATILIGLAVLAAAGRMAFVLAYVPLHASRHSPNRHAAEALKNVLGDGPVCITSSVDLNVMFYLGQPATTIDPQNPAGWNGATVIYDPIDAGSFAGVRLQPLATVPMGTKKTLLAARVSVTGPEVPVAADGR